MASAKKAAKKAAPKNPKPPSKTKPGPFSGKWPWIAQAAVLIALTLIVYLPGFKAPFHFDDLESIINDRYIRMSELTAHNMFLAAFQDFKQNRPLSNLSFALNFYFNIMNPFGYHLVNFLVHLVSGICLWLLLARLFSRRMKDLLTARLVAFLSALLWMVHPVNTQAVTYIVQRHSEMAGAFSLLGLLCFDLGRVSKKIYYYIFSGLACLCALLCKETAYVLPVFIFLYDLFFFQELKEGWLNRNRKWIAGLVVIYVLLSAVALRGQMTGKMKHDFADFTFTPAQRSLTQGRVLLSYLGLVLFPAGSLLSLEHSPEISKSPLQPLTTIPAFLVILGLAGFSLAYARKYPLASFAVLWYFGQLALESLPLPIDIMTEHRLYLASIPVLAMIPCAFGFRLKSLKLGAALCLLVCLFAGILAYERNLVWLTRVSLWRDAVMKAPDNNRPWHNYCSFLIDEEDVNRAGFACKYALILNEKQADTHNNMGICYFKIKMYDQAQKEYLRAIEIDPDFPLAYFNLGLVRASQRDIPKALEYFDKSMELKPKDAKVYLNLGSVYDRLGKPEKSFQAYAMALQARPEWSEARFKVASILAGKGMCPDAVSLLNAAPAQDPQFQQIYDYCRSR